MSTLPLLSDAAALARLMRRAVRVASRGHGGAEPNPMVGCVIATPTGEAIADGHHRRCGEAHAEVDALRAAGARAKGAVAIVTLEPCAHQGRTGPCSEALADAGVAAVVYAVGDPNPIAKGGARRLAERGVATLRFPLPEADLLAAPFLKRVRTGMPWVMLKWAQSLDGRIALASGESKWISGGRSRRMVHRERGRVDAILTGIGTVLEDDPQLVARGVRVARVARRVVFDPQAETPPSAQVCDGRAPTTLLVSGELDAAAERRAASLRARGVDIIELGPSDSLAPALRALAAAGVANILVEAGGGLAGRLIAERLADEAFVFVGPIVIGDSAAPGAVRGLDPRTMDLVSRANLVAIRRRGADALLHYRFTEPITSS